MVDGGGLAAPNSAHLWAGGQAGVWGVGQARRGHVCRAGMCWGHRGHELVCEGRARRTSWVVQMDPLPMPTRSPSAPASISRRACRDRSGWRGRGVKRLLCQGQ